MSFLNAINNSLKSFSKSCFDTMNNNPSKYRGAMIKLKINRASNLTGEVRRYFAEEMKECMKDKEGYFLKLKFDAREGIENAQSQIVHGMNRDAYEMQKQQEIEQKKSGNSKKDDYDIGE